MAPAVTLDWSEPRQHWRYPKFCPSGQQKHERAKSAMELSSKEANTAYKKFCKFLRRLSSKKRKLPRFAAKEDDTLLGEIFLDETLVQRVEMV